MVILFTSISLSIQRERYHLILMYTGSTNTTSRNFLLFHPSKENLVVLSFSCKLFLLLSFILFMKENLMSLSIYYYTLPAFQNRYPGNYQNTIHDTSMHFNFTCTHIHPLTHSLTGEAHSILGPPGCVFFFLLNQ